MDAAARAIVLNVAFDSAFSVELAHSFRCALGAGAQVRQVSALAYGRRRERSESR